MQIHTLQRLTSNSIGAFVGITTASLPTLRPLFKDISTKLSESVSRIRSISRSRSRSLSRSSKQGFHSLRIPEKASGKHRPPVSQQSMDQLQTEQLNRGGVIKTVDFHVYLEQDLESGLSIPSNMGW